MFARKGKNIQRVVSRWLLAVSYAALPRFYSARCAEVLRKTALPIPRAAGCRPYEVKTKTAFYHFHIIIKQALVNGYIELPQIVQTIQKEPT